MKNRLKIDNVEFIGIRSSVKASKYPMSVDTNLCNDSITDTVISLCSSKKGEGHDQMLSGIIVNFDLTFTNKAWIEIERYKFITFVSSQSTMHRITKFDLHNQYNQYVDPRIIDIMIDKIDKYNSMAEFNCPPEVLAKAYLEILYSNPAGFELTARLTTNYRQLKTIYSQRKNHKLPEWREFCKWIESLPDFKLLCLGGEK